MWNGWKASVCAVGIGPPVLPVWRNTPKQGGVFDEGFFRFREERKKRRRPPAGPEVKAAAGGGPCRCGTMQGSGGERDRLFAFGCLFFALGMRRVRSSVITRKRHRPSVERSPEQARPAGQRPKKPILTLRGTCDTPTYECHRSTKSRSALPAFGEGFGRSTSYHESLFHRGFVVLSSVGARPAETAGPCPRTVIGGRSPPAPT
jgi:hypothetical protein